MVLTARLQGLMYVLIDKSLSSFVLGRIIADNIILSHELVKGYEKKGISPTCILKVDIQRFTRMGFYRAGSSIHEFPWQIHLMDHGMSEINHILNLH